MHTQTWLNRVKTVFSIDLRSLALFRILLAVLILWDLALRSADLSAFYTDHGVLAREFLLAVANPWHWSLHAASGALWWQIVLFTLAALCALCLLIGYRSRLMAFLSFVLLASLLNRNPLILTGGDQLLAVMSFWSLFLPLNARYSIDAALQPEFHTNPNTRRFDPTAPQLYFSVATIAVILQVLYLYFFTALMKDGAAWVSRFDAAFYAVSLEQFATPIAIWLRQFPALFTVGTVYVLVVEFIAPILVLLPFAWPRLRTVGLLLLASLHAAFLLMLHIGLFPFIDFMALSLLIPSAFWLFLHQRKVNSKKYQAVSGIRIYYDEDCGFCLKMCLILRELLLNTEVLILPAQSDPAIYAIMERENSWVIQDAVGGKYTHWHAMQFLFSQHLFFKPLAWLMKLKPFMTLGNRVYRWVAINRATMGHLTAWLLPWRPIALRPTLASAGLAAFFFYAVTLFNITGLSGFSQFRPDHVNTAVRITRLDQRWDMFAPFPLTLSLYPQVPGKTRSGETINLFPSTGLEPNWNSPDYLVPVYGGYRWRKYMGRVDGHRNNKVRQSYGRYLCRQSNWQRSKCGL